MADSETCTICLDHLFEGDFPIITRLQPCGHYYHSQCIGPWREKSNTCPTCRNDYETLELIDKDRIIISSTIAEKLDPTSDDDMFESLSDIEEFPAFENFSNHQVDRRINLLVSNSNACILCDSHGGGRITACNSCSSTFHSSCLGLGGLTHWTCPMCDAEQGGFERPSVFRRSRNSVITNRVYNSLRFNPIETPVINEVVEAAEPMSIEEQHAWESFELARSQTAEQIKEEEQRTRNNEMSSSNVIPEADNTPQRFKRPSRSRRQRHRHLPSVEIIPQTTNLQNSLVNTIVDQLKEHRSIFTNPPTTQSRSRSNDRQLESSTSEASLSPSISPSMSPSQSTSTFSPCNSSSESIAVDNSRPFSNKSAWKMSNETNMLSLEQKSTLQEIVRNKLRPLYKDGVVNFDQYTDINKKVSHILYNSYLNDEDPNPDFDMIVDYHVTQEIMNL